MTTDPRVGDMLDWDAIELDKLHIRVQLLEYEIQDQKKRNRANADLWTVVLACLCGFVVGFAVEGDWPVAVVLAAIFYFGLQYLANGGSTEIMGAFSTVIPTLDF